MERLQYMPTKEFGITRAELLRDLVAAIRQPEPPEGAFLVDEIWDEMKQEQPGISRKQVVYYLDLQVQAGELQKDTFGRFAYYWKIEDD